jgi:hypothetical protein
MALVSIDRNPDRRTTRRFAALWFPALMAVVGWLVYRATQNAPAAIAVAAAGAALGAIGFFVERFGRALFVGASYATFPIGFVVSNVIVGVLYFGVITPIGLIMRAFGRDPMSRAFDKTATSYFVKRPPARAAEDYFRQF